MKKKFDKKKFIAEVKDNVKTLYRKNLDEATQEQIFQAVSYAAKDTIIDNWLETQEQYEKQNPKIVYYMSMEFLMGRALGNNLINLCEYDEVKEALEEIGLDLNVIEDQEPDAALGNGGLGRLAACFLDSLATLGYDSYGCGIRYRYGMFKQQIRDGYQVEVPDNWLNGQYHNVPMEEMKAIVDNALQNGYPVVWAADVSEGGFKWRDGVALMPKGKTEGDMNDSELSRWVKLTAAEKNNDKYSFQGPVDEIEVTQELRQEMFDSQETTDDHGMELVGIATDQKGNRYYKVKNSWDTNHIYGGFFYVSEPYFLAKTMNIMVHKNAVPKSIAKKMGVK